MTVAGLEFHLREGKGIFILLRALPKLEVFGATIEGASRPEPGATEPIGSVAGLPPCHSNPAVKPH